MAIATTPRSVAPPLAAGIYDRVFYTGMAITMALAVLIGFGPTYYFRLFSAEGPATTISGALLVLSVPARLILSGTGWWRVIAEFLVK
jgi:hypothetical protein